MSKQIWEVDLKRVIPVPQTEVYRAITDPDLLAKWWGPRGFTAPEVDFEPRVGHSYRIAMQPPDGEMFYLSGEFREFDPPKTLAFTFRWDPPDPDDQETLARLSLQDLGEETELHLAQGPFATESRRNLHEGGWTDGFGRLEDVLREAGGIYKG